MQRREFGRRALELAAAAGLRSVNGRTLSGFGGLAGCTLPVDRANGARAALTGGTERSVVIVGSGYGSAVTALRLTEAGIPVTMYEMGRLWDTPGMDGNIFCPLLQPDGRAMWFKDRTEAVATTFGPIETAMAVPRQAGILDVLGPPEMRVFCGRGVGGGSLVNLAIYAQPVREVFQRVLPDVDVDAMLQTYYPRALAGLRASQVPQSLVDSDCYRYSRVGIAAADALGIDCIRVTSGYDYDYMQKEVAGSVPRSALGGEAAYGNNHGKRSLDKTYIADAMGTGLLTIHALSQVVRITRAVGGGYVLQVREIDIDGNVLSEYQQPCTHLFLGGGSLGTSELLVRARERGDLPELNASIGTAWGPNSDIFVPRDNAIWNPTGDLQASVPSSAFYTRDAAGKHVFSMIIPLPVGIETWISFNIVITESKEAGHFVYDSTTDTVELKWAAGQSDPAVASARSIFDKINQKTGSTYNTGLFGGSKEVGDNATYHPVGGCPLGRATDAFGRVSHYPQLYVVDGSLIPVGIGANPSFTITALAERNIERVLAEDLS